MHEDKCQSDGQARQFTGPFLFVCSSQCYKNENKCKNGLGNKGL